MLLQVTGSIMRYLKLCKYLNRVCVALSSGFKTFLYLNTVNPKPRATNFHAQESRYG